jgi:hypothetical protein
MASGALAKLTGRLSLFRNPFKALPPPPPAMKDPWAAHEAWRDVYNPRENIKMIIPGWQYGVGIFLVAAIAEELFAKIKR